MAACWNTEVQFNTKEPLFFQEKVLKPNLYCNLVFRRLRISQYWVLTLHFLKVTHLSNLEFVAGRADQVHKAKPVTDCYLKAIPCLKKNCFSWICQALLISTIIFLIISPIYLEWCLHSKHISICLSKTVM